MIHEKFWTDEKIHKLKPFEKYLFLYFITNPHAHYSGIYYLPLELISIETGLTKEELKYPLDTLSMGYFVKFDVENSLIWVKNMAKYQAQGEKQIKGIANHLSTLPKSSVIKDFLIFYENFKIPYQYPPDTPSMGVLSGSGEGTEEEEEKGKEEETKKNYNFEKFIFNHWNSKNIYIHKDFNKFCPFISGRLKIYTKEEIVGAIDNYSIIISDKEKYYFSKKWTLDQFLEQKNAIDKFLPINFNSEDYKKFDKKGNKQINMDDLDKMFSKTKT